VQLDNIDFEDTCVDALEEMTLHGTVICKAGWEVQTEIRKRFLRKKQPLSIKMPLGQPDLTINTKESDEFEVTPVPLTRSQPVLREVRARHCADRSEVEASQPAA